MIPMESTFWFRNQPLQSLSSPYQECKTDEEYMWGILLVFSINFTLCGTFYLTFTLESFTASDFVQTRTFVEVSVQRILTRIITEVEVEERKKERKKEKRPGNWRLLNIEYIVFGKTETRLFASLCDSKPFWIALTF